MRDGNFRLPTVTNDQQVAVATGVVAKAGGTKALATQLTGLINVISTCATGADSVMLPPALKGAEIIVINDGAAAAQVFGQGTDTIDGVATATGVVLTNAKRCLYVCSADGKWLSLMGVKSA